MLVQSEMRFPSRLAQIRLVRKLVCGMGTLCCLCLLVAGCGGNKRSADHVDVSGDVTYKGKPVTGGRVTFVAIPKDATKDQAFSANGIIDENGHYTIKAPVGDVKITVDNSMLNLSNPNAKKQQGAGRPGAGEPDPVKGKYIDLPSDYRNTEKTPLTWTVTKDQTTHNIELK